MPENTPQIKIDAVKDLGAKVILHGAVFDEAQEQALKLAKKNKLQFIHPYGRSGSHSRPRHSGNGIDASAF